MMTSSIDSGCTFVGWEGGLVQVKHSWNDRSLICHLLGPTAKLPVLLACLCSFPIILYTSYSKSLSLILQVIFHFGEENVYLILHSRIIFGSNILLLYRRLRSPYVASSTCNCKRKLGMWKPNSGFG